MPNAIIFKSPDMKRFGKYMASNPDIMLKNARIAMKKGTLLLERSMKKFAPSGEGTLRKSIIAEIKPFSGVVKAMAKHAVFVHEGTRPHFPPMTPNSSLDRWAKSKGIPTFLVARAIARKGTKAQPFRDEAVKYQEANIDKLAKKALNDTANAIAKA